MGRNTTSAPAFLAAVSCTEKSVAVARVKVVSETISKAPLASASFTKVSRIPCE